MKNPAWTKEEIILALDLYFKKINSGASFNRTEPEIIELSYLLRLANFHPDNTKSENFRSVDSIVFKLNNIMYIDKGKGAKNHSDLDLSTYQEFVNDRTNLTILAKKIRTKIFEKTLIKNKEIEEDFNTEVQKSKIMSEEELKSIPNTIEISKNVKNYNYFKRNSKLSKTVLFKSDYKCEACNVKTFKSKSGMPNYVEAHHLIPINQQYNDIFKMEYKMYKSLDIECNIVSLCPNCHAKFHYGDSDEVKEIIKLLYYNREEKLTSIFEKINLNKLYEFYNVD